MASKQQTQNMKLKNILSLGVACSAMLATSHAQEEESPFSFSLSLDQNSHFMSYGANVWGSNTEDIGDGGTFNPSFVVNYALSETSGWYAGVWYDVNSYSDAPEIGPDLGSKVQEMDVFVGYYFGLGKLSVDLTYQAWLYAGENEGIFDIALSYDTLLSPYVKFHNRFESNGGQQKGTMIEVGGTLHEGTVGSVGYSVSSGLGFSLDDYHVPGEDGYAYSYIGVSGSKVIYSSDSLEADLHGGLTYFNTDDDTVGNPDDSFLTMNVGVGFSF